MFWLDRLPYRTLQWLVAAFAVLHDLEEALTIPRYAPAVRQRLSHVLPPTVLAATQNPSWVYAALAVATVIPILVVLVATTRRSSRGAAWAVASSVAIAGERRGPAYSGCGGRGWVRAGADDGGGDQSAVFGVLPGAQCARRRPESRAGSAGCGACGARARRGTWYAVPGCRQPGVTRGSAHRAVAPNAADTCSSVPRGALRCAGTPERTTDPGPHRYRCPVLRMGYRPSLESQENRDDR